VMSYSPACSIISIRSEGMQFLRSINQFIDWSTYSLTSLFVSDSLTT